jgi:hypothetical protein
MGQGARSIQGLWEESMNLSHYEPLNPNMDDGDGQKRVEAD